MSQENTNNSWYKFLESIQGTSTSIPTALDCRNIVLSQLHGSNPDPESKLCFLSYNCLLCMKSIIEIRLKSMCEHIYCETCMPRIHCSKECRPWLIHSLPADDLKSQQEIINKFKDKFDVKVVKVGPTNKRKKSESEDDEMQE